MQWLKLLGVGALLMVSFLSAPHSLASSNHSSDETENEISFGELPSFSGQISGEYSDPSIGLEITIPEGWSGIGFPGFAIISPSGPLVRYTQQSEVSMLIASVNVSEAAKNPVFGSTVDIDPMQEAQNQNMTANCIWHMSYETVAGLNVMHAFNECRDKASGTYSVSNIYNAARKGQIVAVGISSQSEESYRQHIDAFEASVRTMKVSDAIDHREVWYEPLGVKTDTYEVIAKGNPVELTVDTSSELSGFSFNEEQKTVSFQTDGANGTIGLTVIPIGTILEGPYVVTVDGETALPLGIFDDRIANVTRLEVQYPNGAHSVMISGTTVVPGFPLGMLGVVAATVTAAVVAAGRLKRQN